MKEPSRGKLKAETIRISERTASVTDQEARCMGRMRGDLGRRTFRFALEILEIADELPPNNNGWIMARQLIRNGTSIGANVREADHAHTDLDFPHRCNIALREASETESWLMLFREAELFVDERLTGLLKQVDELIRIPTTIVKKTQTAFRTPRPN
jgi:four helix bundle protein